MHGATIKIMRYLDIAVVIVFTAIIIIVIVERFHLYFVGFWLIVNFYKLNMWK